MRNAAGRACTNRHIATDELAEAVQEKVKAVSHGKELKDRLDVLTAENAELGKRHIFSVIELPCSQTYNVDNAL